MENKIKQLIKYTLYHFGLLKILYPNKASTLRKNFRIRKTNQPILKEKKRIMQIPRYTKGIFQIKTNKIKFIDSASFLFMYNEIFEKEIYKFNTNIIDPFIIDCGANIGLSVLYFKMLYPKARIVAFEPDIEIFDVLKMNCESHNLTDLNLINYAVWNKDTIIDFYIEGADGGRIALSTDQDKIKQIKTVRLKKFLLDKKVDFLKIDVEGAELQILIDCKEELKNVDKIFIEFHSFIEQDQHLDIILNILKESGFRIHINNPGLTSIQPFMNLNSYAKMDMQLNIYGF